MSLDVKTQNSKLEIRRVKEVRGSQHSLQRHGDIIHLNCCIHFACIHLTCSPYIKPVLHRFTVNPDTHRCSKVHVYHI